MPAVLLDVDGTLIASNEAHAKAWARALDAYGYAVPAERILGWIGMGGGKILKRIDPRLDSETGVGASVGQLRLRLFLGEYLPQLHPTNGARALLERLRESHLQRVVATSAKKDELDALLRQAGIEDQIDLAVTSDDVARSKPDSDVVHVALAKASRRPDQAVYVGDTPYDIEAAHGAGVATIAVRSGGWTDSALASAEAIYEDPADLLAHFDVSPLIRLCRP
ncbi:MAG: HAD family hydrolase [Candidatus Tumulicola sp.]